jgi:predicted ArsR family transcriptional regulator
LGLLASVERHGDHVLVRGCSCPVSEVVADHPEICEVAARVLTGAIGCDVQERCDRSGSPRCIFRISKFPRGQIIWPERSGQATHEGALRFAQFKAKKRQM